MLAACGSPTVAGRPSRSPAKASPVRTETPSRHERALRDARYLIGLVTPPAGAREVAREPVGDRGLLGRPAASPLDFNLVTVTRFYVVRGSAKAALDRISGERPAGFDARSGRGRLWAGSAVEEWMTFSWPPVGQLLDQRTVLVGAVNLPGGRAGLRIDAEVTWLPPKPPGDLVKGEVEAITAALSRGLSPGEHAHGPVTTTDQRTIAEIVAHLDALSVVSLPPSSCPADTGGVLTVRFRRRLHARPFAVALADTTACQSVQVRRGDRRVRPLLNGYGFACFVETKLHMAPCRS